MEISRESNGINTLTAILISVIDLSLFFICSFLFNSLFTADFSIVIITNLHRLTENFIIKRKIYKHFKRSHQRRIQNPVKAGDGDSFENSQPLQVVNYFLKKPHHRCLTSIIWLRLQRQFNIAFNICDVRLTLIATLTIH